MPVTPFHFGPGALIKSFAPRHFSLSVFALSQGLIDLEPAYYWLRDQDPWHRFFHTYAGAAVIALISLFVGKWLCPWFLRWWNRQLSAAQARWLEVRAEISWVGAASGAIIGAYSHVFLDSIMHADMRPLAPFADSNALHGVISIDSLYAACFLAGVVGVLVMLVARARGRL